MRKINIYRCPQGHEIVTIDKDEGTAPFLTNCQKCSAIATSQFYLVDQTLKPTHEWYKPELTNLDPALKDHVIKGGLILRKIE